MITCSFFFLIFPIMLFWRESSETLVLFPTKKTPLHQDRLFFFFNIISFHTVVEVAFLTAQKYNQTFETWGLQGFKDDLRSEMIFLNLALFGSPDDPGCGVMCSLMPFKCRRRLFVFSSLAFFTRLEMSDKNCSVLCSEVCPMLLSGRWWKHLSLSGFQMRELKE